MRLKLINPIGIGEPIKGCLIIALSALFCFVFRKPCYGELEDNNGEDCRLR